MNFVNNCIKALIKLSHLPHSVTGSSGSSGTSVTVTAQSAVNAPHVAVIVAAPSPIAVTSPSPSTVATAGSELSQVMGVVSAAGSGVAVSCKVSPTSKSAVAWEIVSPVRDGA